MQNQAAVPVAHRWLRTACLLTLITLAHVPLLVDFAVGLWNRPCYQFFPFAVAGVAFLLWRRWPADRAWENGSGERLETTLLVLGVVTLVVAIVLWSPWLGALAALLNSTALLLHCVGLRGMWHLLPVWAVMLLIIPPPLGLDQRLMQFPQRLTAWAGSRALDKLKIDHVRQGTILLFPDRELRVHDAGAGTPSLPAILALTVLLSVWMGRPLFWSLVLLASSVAWYGLGVFLHVVADAAAPVQFGVDLSAGWFAGLLGAAVYLVVLALLLSTDGLLFVLLAPIPLDPDLAPHNPVCEYWNRHISDRFFVAYEATEDELPFDKEHEVEEDEVSDSATESGTAAQVLVGDSVDHEPVGMQQPNFGGRFWRSLAVLAGVLVALQVPIILPSGQRDALSGPNPASVAVLLERIAADFLPQQVDGWKQVAFKTVRREPVAGQHGFSQSWTYEKAKRSAIVSFVCTTDDNLLANCRRDGWRVAHQVVASGAPSSAERATSTWIEADLMKPKDEFGYLVCGLTDENGKSLPLETQRTGAGLIDRLKGNPLWSTFKRSSPRHTARLGIQFQVLVTTNHRLPADDQGQVRTLFVQLRDSLPSQWQAFSKRKARAVRDQRD